tara:strand:- start:191 stop:490 length:300 start_codon:yes stop_codon:yes gene_type:complete
MGIKAKEVYMLEMLSPETKRALIRNENMKQSGLTINIESIKSGLYRVIEMFLVTFYLFGAKAGTSIAFRDREAMDDFFKSLQGQYSKTAYLTSTIERCG